MHCSCVYVDCDAFTTRIKAGVVRARKQHTCDECQRTIEVGEAYENYAGRASNAGFFVHKTCSDCLSLRKAMFCEAWAWGHLWEDVGQHVDDTYGEISSECLLELTPSARETLIGMIDELWEEDDD